MSGKLKAMACILPCLLGALALLALGGCEGDSNEDVSGVDGYFKNNPYSSAPRETPAAPELTISPAQFTVSFVNQEVVFSAGGGEGAYHWYVSNHANGEINSHGANQAVYIVKQVAVNSITVQDDVGHYGVAYIMTATSTGAVTMTVSPSAVTLSGGQQHASFTVTGGTAPYTWTSGNVRLGTVSYSAGTSYVAAYTAVSGAYGQNVVTVRDAEGRVASATVTQTQ